MKKIFIALAFFLTISCSKDTDNQRMYGNTPNSIFNEMAGKYFQVVYPNSLGPDSCIKDQKAVVFFANDTVAQLRKYRKSDCNPVMVVYGKNYKIKVFSTSLRWIDPIYNEGSCTTTKYGEYYVLTPGEFGYSATPVSDTLMLLSGSHPEK